MMRGVCEECGLDADYCDSVPDASIKGCHPSECGYRYQPLCWLHAAIRREVATSRVRPILVFEGVGYLDFDRASGLCVCPECGRQYYDHPQFKHAPYLNQLCDGRLVKL